MGWGNIKTLAEKHPYMLAGGVFLIGAVLIYYFYSGGSSSSTTSAAAANQNAQAAAIASGNALQAAQLQDQTQLGVASLAAGVQNTQMNDALALGENTNVTTLEAIQNQTYNQTDQAWIAEQGNEYAQSQQTAVLEANNTRDVSLANIAANESVAQLQTVANLTKG